MCTLEKMLILHLEKVKHVTEFIDYFRMPDHVSDEMKLIFQKMTNLNPDMRPDAELLLSEKCIIKTKTPYSKISCF